MSDTLIATLVAAVVLALLFMQVFPFLRARRMRGQPAPSLDAVLHEGQRGLSRYLVYFWAPSCGMCRNMTPIIERLAHENPSVVAVDASRHVDLALACGVMGTPTLVLIENGRIEAMQVGARSEAQIRALLE